MPPRRSETVMLGVSSSRCLKIKQKVKASVETLCKAKKTRQTHLPPRKIRAVNLLKELHGVGVHGESRDVDLGLLRNKVHATLALSLLQLQRDVANRTLLDALHKVSHEAGNLVAQTLGGDDGDFLRDLLVKLEVQSELGVVLLDDLTSRALDCLGADATHIC
jgi:hypothetical protein